MSRPDLILARFEEDLGGASWFSATGSGAPPATIREIGLYLEGLGQPAGRVETVEEWKAAGAALRREAWNRSWWTAEQAEQRALTARIAAVLAERSVARRLSAILLAAGDRALTDATASLTHAAVSDPGLAASAAGAAGEAVHQASLAVLAGTADTHPFRIKLRHFMAGHWPLGLFGGAFLLL